jgi:hypothetical protein
MQKSFLAGILAKTAGFECSSVGGFVSLRMRCAAAARLRAQGCARQSRSPRESVPPSAHRHTPRAPAPFKLHVHVCKRERAA